MTITARKILEYLRQRRMGQGASTDDPAGWTGGYQIMAALRLDEAEYLREAQVLSEEGYIESGVDGPGAEINSTNMAVRITPVGMDALAATEKKA